MNCYESEENVKIWHNLLCVLTIFVYLVLRALIRFIFSLYYAVPTLDFANDIRD